MPLQKNETTKRSRTLTVSGSIFMETICHTPGVMRSTAAANSVLSTSRSCFLPRPATRYVLPQIETVGAVGSSGLDASEICDNNAMD